jgi:hypothetical protein
LLKNSVLEYVYNSILWGTMTEKPEMKDEIYGYLNDIVITHTLIADGGEHFTAHEKFQISGHHPAIRYGQYPF